MPEPKGTAKVGLIHKGTPPVITQEQYDYIVSQVPPTDISGKVDKATGKGLSTNDLTFKITQDTIPPSNPSVGDWWLDTN